MRLKIRCDEKFWKILCFEVEVNKTYTTHMNRPPEMMAGVRSVPLPTAPAAGADDSLVTTLSLYGLV